jgi:hypothetical protein
MAWTKVKTAMVIGAGVLVAGTTTLILCNLAWPLRSIPTDWTVIDGNSEQWHWAKGKINAHSITGETILASGREYRDVTLSATAGTTNREASLAFRLQDANNGYLVIFAPAGTPREDAGCVLLIKKEEGTEVTLASYRGRVLSSLGQSAKIAVTARGSLIEIRLKDVRILRVKDTTYATGLIGLRIFGDPEYPCDSTFSNVTLN